MGNVTLKTKFVVLISALIAASLLANLAWTSVNKRAQMENELREKGEVLAQQMDAMWEFMASNQDRLEQISYTEDGIYQGLHCAIVGRSIGLLFTSQSEYETRFVNFDPRNAADAPDEFEAAALNAFKEEGLAEYYEVTEYEGEEVFRYLAPMTIEENCLDCHGEPKGEIDVTGFPKEGWSIGDNGGAISIIMPLDVYRENEQSAIVQDVIFFGGMLAFCLVVVYVALGYLVTRPLNKIQAGVEQIQTGNLDVELAYTESSREMNTLTADFNQMAEELSAIYGNLETQVEDRTAQLARANDVLERQRAQLEDANDRLRDENRYKSDFLAIMSHELRTPLTSIIAFAEMLNKESDPKNEKEAETRREIEANSRALLFMINDILEMSRLDAGRIEMNVETVDLGDIAGLVQSVVQPLAKQNGIEFTCEIDADVPLVEADFEKLRHVLENLAGNAVKFTPEGGSVRLAISYHPECGEVWLRVADTGIGIAKKDQQRVFERFVQADSSASRKYSGTGLGLALAKEYTEMHNGSISVESVLGKGSVFTVRIPAKRSASDDEGDGE
ncbi:c-type heme family protein [Raoultibacter massiliensis]|uniref:histidine kinase n=1 Tax=Raoultibacter massiliensis TaxID=1852371 RepID=A0ABV1JDJ2_9ACTN